MISRLTGILAAKRAPQILIDCHGVGYEADVSMTTFYKLPEVGQQISIWTHLLVKEDSHSLIGFDNEQERKLFRQLIRITGVGPKMALTILSGIDELQFALCIANNDIAMLTRLPGVGKKTAERLVIEMRDRLADWDGSTASAAGGVTSAGADVANPVEEAVSALTALGYKPQDASRMVRAVDSKGLTTEAIIRTALQATVQ